MKKLFLSLIFSLFLISFLVGRADTTRADIDTVNIRYTSVKIEYGDSLDSISQEYNNLGISHEAYKESIMQINNMTEAKVHPGCFISVSYRADR